MRENKIRILHVAQAAGGVDCYIRMLLKYLDKHRTFNLGCGYGTSIKDVLKSIEHALNLKLNILYTESRSVDVPINYLDISRYEKYYGKLNPISLEEGIKNTAEFMRREYL